MNTINNIRTELEDQWNTCQKNWNCAAQKRFHRVWCTPMLAQIDALDCACDELEKLCQESMALAKSVREPDDQEWRNETWQRD